MKRQEGAGGERLQPGGLDVAPNEKIASLVGNSIESLATLATLAIAASATAANPANPFDSEPNTIRPCATPANPFD